MSDWLTACPDWENRIRTSQTLVPDLPLFRGESDRAVAIFNRLRLPDVPGQPVMAEACGDWARDLVAALFGSYDPVADVRHIREVFELVPKKNSKTTKGAAIMLTAVLMSRRPRAEYLMVAPTHDVANLAYSQLVGMIEADEVLKAKFHVRDHIKQVIYRPTGAFLKVKSFDPKIVTGAKPAGVLLDELHVIAENHNADRVIGQLRGGLISQPEGFLLTITTQSERPPTGVFKAELQKARSVRDGKLIAPVLPILYEFPRDVDWRNTNNWHMVTPNNGRSITVDRLIPDYEGAEASGEEELRRWASQHLNVEIGMALKSDGWAGADFWEQCKDLRPVTLDRVLNECEVIDIGIDGGGLDDLLGLAVMGRVKGSQHWMLWTHAWAHPSVMKRHKQEASRFNDFRNDGDLTIVERIGEDVEGVAAICSRVERSGLLDKIGVDPHGLGGIMAEIENAGVPSDMIIGISQGWRMTGAIKTMERKLAESGVIHGGQPLMTWCVSNAKVEPRGNAVIITKAGSGSAKIDCLMAALDAVSLLSLNPDSADSSHQLIVI
jgi:phage terminase large subunit-like protein